ncbi:MAG TPA: TonB-dependent receptor, partial [Tenacibaculum sp.]|nr:TonB-dependent receptor [Tenacibaculum sp.]
MKQLIIILFFPVFIFAQKTAILKGKVTDRNNNPIENVAITYSDKGTTSDKNGNYKLSIPIHKTTVVTFSHISFEKKIKKFTARGTKTFNYFPKLEALDKNLKEVVVKNRKKEAQGMLKINSKKMNDLIGANAGVENILMTLPGVNNNNELSTQYNVRGGNFDENLVYVNGIEVYRPFLIRSGQQEGLSFINSQMVQNINFSAGGFQARYGDRLSSVLDITYRKPQSFKAQIDLSLLGANISVENSYLNNQLNVIVGVRYRDNSLFVNNKQTEVNFRPQFTDFQTYLSYKYSNKLTLNFLSNFSLNKYNYKPLTRKTRFGGFVNPIELVVFYQGQEKDEFKTLFGAFSADYKINENLKLTGTISSFNTQEEEYFDIAAAYNLG